MSVPWIGYQKFWLRCVTTKKIPCTYWALQDLQQQQLKCGGRSTHENGQQNCTNVNINHFISPVYTIRPVVKPVVKTVWHPVNVCIHDTTGCQTRCQTGLTTGCIVYANIQPVVKPIWQLVWQPVVSCKRGNTMPSVHQSTHQQLVKGRSKKTTGQHGQLGVAPA